METIGSDRRWSAAGWLVCGAYGLIAALTLTDYGISWDETLQREYGTRVLRYYTSGFQDHSYANLEDLRFYGPAFELIAVALERLVPVNPWDLRHALIVVCGVGTLIAVMKIAALLGGARAGLLAVLLLVLTPQFYGHTFINSKDIPFAAAFSWTAWAFMRFIESRAWRFAILTGIFLGLLLSIRIGGIFICALMVVAVVREWIARRAGIGSDILKLAVVVMIAWAVMVALWPPAHAAPLDHPLQSFRVAVAFPTILATFFEGSIWFSNTLPARYLPKMLLITTPLVILLLAIIGLVAVTIGLRQEDRRTARIFLVLWMIVPVAVYVVRRPPVYDGIRHFLFLLPAMAIFAALGYQRIERRLRGGVLAAALAVGLAPVLIAMVRLHPYQYTYYNELAGGTGQASARYETDYWISSYREAMEWVKDHRCEGRETRILMAVSRHFQPAADFYAADGMSVTVSMKRSRSPHLPEQLDYYVGTTRLGMATQFPAAPIAAVIGRDGATFSVVRGGCRSASAAR